MKSYEGRFCLKFPHLIAVLETYLEDLVDNIKYLLHGK